MSLTLNKSLKTMSMYGCQTVKQVIKNSSTTNNSGVYFFRKWPCYCFNCKYSAQANCLNEAIVGEWYSKTQKYKGIRTTTICSVVTKE